MRLRNLIFALLLAIGAVGFTACFEGDAGPQGPKGETGPPGMDAPEQTDGDGMDGDDMGKAECTHEFGPRDRNFTGSSGNDVICANDRNNNPIEGMGGDDTIRGEGGNDTLNGGVGNDMLYGGAGNDELNGGLGNDELHGEAGDDTLNGDDGHDMLFGGEGKDILNGGLGNDEIDGGSGDDTIKDYDLSGIDYVEGGEGTDTLDYSMIPDDSDTDNQTGFEVGDLNGNYLHVSLADGEAALGNIVQGAFVEVELLEDISGIENVIGSSTGKNHLVGDGKDNNFRGGEADGDKIKGMDGNDTLGVHSTDQGDDLFDGGDGNDTLIVSGDFNLTAQAAPSAEVGVRNIENLMAEDVDKDVTAVQNNLDGDKGPNRLYGGFEADNLNGGEGNDTLNGGPGADVLTGGKGADTFIIMKGEGGDTIGSTSSADFSAADGDKIYLKGFNAEDKKAGIDINAHDTNANGSPFVISAAGATVVTVHGTGVSSSNVKFMD